MGHVTRAVAKSGEGEGWWDEEVGREASGRVEECWSAVVGYLGEDASKTGSIDRPDGEDFDGGDLLGEW